MTLKPTSDAVAVTQGSAGDAIDFALGHCGPDEAFAFLDDWRADRANEWPGYVKWLSAQYRHRTAAQPEREFQEGDKVHKASGYRWPGEVVAVFKTRAGKTRIVVECTVPEVAGALHIYSPEQLELEG